MTDLAATRQFYVGGLGWEPELDVPGRQLDGGAGVQHVLDERVDVVRALGRLGQQRAEVEITVDGQEPQVRPAQVSPSVQNAKIVSSACRPSGRRPRTCSARFNLAGAGSDRTVKARR